MWQLCIISALIVTSFHLIAAEQSYQESGCECVPYYKCQKPNVVGGEIILPKRYVPCEGAIEVCCEPAYIGDKEQIIDNRLGWQHDGCGKPSYDSNNTEVNSDDPRNAEFGEFPWMAAIYQTQRNSQGGVVGHYLCGGALIRSNAVLTAAHCVNGKLATQMVVRLGVRNFATSNDIKPYQLHSVNKVMIHKDFVQKSHVNDFAILFLSTSVNFTENVDLACLPEPDQQFDGSNCVVSRWGSLTKGHLQRAALSIIGHNQCENIFRDALKNPSFWIHESFTCATGTTALNPGQGDDGSPLVCPLKTFPFRYVLAGIVVVKSPITNSQTIEIYTNVSAARNWINERITDYNWYPY